MNRGRLKQLASETIVYGLPSVFLKLLGFITVPIFTRLLTPADYGILGMTTSITGLMAGILMLGLDTSTSILFFQSNEAEDRSRTVASWLFPYFAITATGSLILAICSPWIAAQFLGSRDNFSLLCLVAVAQFLTGLSSVSNLLFRLQRFKWRAIGLSLAQGLTSTACSLLFVAVFKQGVRGIYFSQLVTGVIFFLLNIWIMRQWLKPAFFSRNRFGQLLKLGIPVVPAYLAYWVINLMDRFFVEHYRGLTDVGLINVAQSLTLAVAFVCQAFQQAIGPFALSIKDESNVRETYARILTYFLLLTSLGAVALSIFSPELLALLTPHSYHGAASVVAFYAFAAISGGVGFIAGIGISISKRTIHAGWTSFVAAAINVLLNFILVPRYGMIGSAISTVTAQWTGAMLLFAMAQRCYYIPYRWKDMAIILTSSAAVICLSAEMRMPDRMWAVVLKAGGVSAFVLTMVLFRVITPQELSVVFDQFKKTLSWAKSKSPSVC